MVFQKNQPSGPRVTPGMVERAKERLKNFKPPVVSEQQKIVPNEGYKIQFWDSWKHRGLNEEAIQAKWEELKANGR